MGSGEIQQHRLHSHTDAHHAPHHAPIHSSLCNTMLMICNDYKLLVRDFDDGFTGHVRCPLQNVVDGLGSVLQPVDDVLVHFILPVPNELRHLLIEVEIAHLLHEVRENKSTQSKGFAVDLPRVLKRKHFGELITFCISSRRLKRLTLIPYLSGELYSPVYPAHCTGRKSASSYHAQRRITAHNDPPKRLSIINGDLNGLSTKSIPVNVHRSVFLEYRFDVFLLVVEGVINAQLALQELDFLIRTGGRNDLEAVVLG